MYQYYSIEIMKTKKRISIYIAISIIFTIIYLLFAAKPLAHEYQFIPQWKISTLTPVTKNAGDYEKMYFKLGQTAGYFTETGDITHYNTFSSKIAISDYYYSNYASDAKNLPFFDNQGKKLGTIEPAGYPFFIENQIYVFLPGGCNFAKCNNDGSLNWKSQSTIPITAFNSNENFCIVGYADGTIKVFNTNDGTCVMQNFPGGNERPVILGVAISDDGNYMASISGHNKQRFVLAKIVNNKPKIIHHKFLNDEIYSQILIKFTDNNNSVLYNYNNNIGIYNISKDTTTTIPAKNKLITMEEADSIIYALGKDKNNYTVYVIEKTNTLIGTFSFNADKAFIKTNKDYLYIGKDNSISQILVTKK